MSKEKQCECCHEWWYDSDVKENLCPNCYDYFKQLKQQLEEKDKEIERLNHKLNVEEPCLIRNYKDMLEQLIQSHTQLEQEIEKLKQQYTILENENDKLAKDLIVKNYKKAKKEVSFGIQLAIQELEKVKNFIDGRTYCADYINKRIQELKGE